jgi:mRNA interferase RelE/StbE
LDPGPFELRLSRDAERYVERLDTPTRARIINRLNQIASDPFGPITKPLEGHHGMRAARVGGYRIIFSVDVGTREVLVSDIGPRGQIYRGL